MRMLRVLLVLAILVAALGFFRGWFSFSSHGPNAVDGKVNVSLTVDPEKMQDDATRVRDKTSDVADQTAEEARDLGDQAKDKLDPNDR